MAVLEIDLLRTVVGISVLVFVARTLASVCLRLKVPEVIGEVTAGIVVGPFALGGVIRLFNGPLVASDDELLQAFALIGGMIILFAAGLEFTFAEFRASGLPSFVVGALGVGIPFALGYWVPLIFGFPWQTAMLVGATLTATSIALTVRTLEELNQIRSEEARIMVNAAVIDDVLGLAVFAVIISIFQLGVVPSASEILFKVVQVTILWFSLLIVAVVLIPRFIKLAARWPAQGSVEAGATAACFGSAAAAAGIGLSPVVGAFAAGMALAESHLIGKVKEYVEKLKLIFAPLFFAVVGTFLDPSKIVNVSLGLFLVLVSVAIISKVVACGVPAGYFLKDADRGLRVGIGMASRGEVGFVIAALGLTSGVILEDVYAALVAVILATTLFSPILLRRTFRAPIIGNGRLKRIFSK